MLVLVGFRASRLILICLLRYSSLGVLPHWRGVALYLKSISSTFFRTGCLSSVMANSLCFRVCTFRSAKPFVAGCPGAMYFWNVPVVLQKVWNSSLVNIDALSDTITSGNPFRANTSCSISIVDVDVGAFLHGIISAHFDFASIITKK